MCWKYTFSFTCFHTELKVYIYQVQSRLVVLSDPTLLNPVNLKKKENAAFKSFPASVFYFFIIIFLKVVSHHQNDLRNLTCVMGDYTTFSFLIFI